MYMYNHDTKATETIVIYCQVHDILDEACDKKWSFVEKELHVITSSLVLTWICWFAFFNTIVMVWCILHAT
jgi:hypothetical protein